MVQLYDQGGFPGPGPNEYWKLDSGTALTTHSLREYLSNKDFTTLKQTTKPRLSELYIRCQRGLLSYEGRSLRELREFTAQRAVLVDSKATLNSIKALKGLLEKADDDITFNRFPDLPPELRQIVFLHYFDSLVVRDAWYKHQPPVNLLSSRATSAKSHCLSSTNAVISRSVHSATSVPSLANSFLMLRRHH